MPDFQPFIAFANRLADAAGRVARRYFRAPVEVAYKADISPVTRADREVETLLRELIAGEFPDHGIVGEEFPSLAPEAEFVWVLDPIDGTRLFLAGLPLFATLIALTRGGVPVLGLIDQPITGERWIGGEGLASQCNGRAIRVRPCPELDRALLCASSPHHFLGAEGGAFERLRAAVSWTQYGADGYGLAMIANGRIDLGVETGLGPYDFLAPAAVIAGAGGVATDWQGQPLTLGSGPRMLAAGDARAHARALDRLAG